MATRRMSAQRGQSGRSVGHLFGSGGCDSGGRMPGIGKKQHLILHADQMLKHRGDMKHDTDNYLGRQTYSGPGLSALETPAESTAV